MKTTLKILVISLLATIVYIVGSAVMPFSEPFKEANQNSNPSDMIYLLIVNIWFTYSVFYIGKHSVWSKRRLAYSLFFVYGTVYSFMTQIETIFFGEAFELLSKTDGWTIMLMNLIPFFVIIPLSLKLSSNNYPEKNPSVEIKIPTLFRKIGILAISYAIIYFLFGYFVAWQFADLREFYSGSAEKQTFIQVMIGNFNDSSIIPFQILRGILFSLFILPIVFMLQNNSKQLLIGLVLVFLSTAIVLIMPNFLFPETVRLAHFIEMMTSMTVFSIITWLVWRK